MLISIKNFSDWLDKRWPYPTQVSQIAVGCGAGAFTELVNKDCAPTALVGIDPSQDQIAYAKKMRGHIAECRVGDAMALPFEADRFDVAVMALVIFFVPQPLTGVREMAGVVAPGQMVASYTWDLVGGGSPTHMISEALVKLDVFRPKAPNGAVSQMDALHNLWAQAGLTAIRSKEITVTRTFVDFAIFWENTWLSPNRRKAREKVSNTVLEHVKNSLEARLEINSDGGIPVDGTLSPSRSAAPR